MRKIEKTIGAPQFLRCPFWHPSGFRLDSQQKGTEQKRKEENRKELNKKEERAEEADPWEVGEDFAPAPEKYSAG
ncbi:MAG: hypothetical protein IKJ94_01235 [Oscillospiraceae bacterium]|nr:hypothetical protein [Oscillospiraceae bacterium]